ncbi:MAG: xanthine dehydrogenase family protein molybdopterin-binding subunit [Phycisphaerae bacterium]
MSEKNHSAERASTGAGGIGAQPPRPAAADESRDAASRTATHVSTIPTTPTTGESLPEPSRTPYKEAPRGPVGRSERRIDGKEKVTGTALYGADLFPNRADYFAQVVRSDQAHARLTAVKKENALRIPGVIAVHTAEDMPGTNRQGLIHRDHPVLVEDHIRFRGDAIAIVVAETEIAARRGREAVEVDYEPLPVVATMDDALAPGAPKLHPDGNIMGGKRIRKGDVDAALAASDAIVSETFVTQTVDHAFLDLEAGIACWDGRLLTIHASGQWAHEERRLTALALGLPIESVRIITPATGGAFGGREDISIQITLGMAALRHPGKTIAMRYSREESMRARHKRHALRIYYTLGASADGTLTAAKITVFSNEGAYASTGPAVLRKAASHSTGPYRVPNVHVDVYGIFTNNNPTGAMRGFGACQMAIAYEGMMDRLAKRLDMDRVELRRKNLIRSGESVTTGQHIPIVTAEQCMDAALAKFQGNTGAPPISSRGTGPCGTGPCGTGPCGTGVSPVNKGRSGRATDPPLAPHQRRGWGISVICFGLGYGDGFPDASRATVKFNRQDRLEVYTGGVEYGQGLLNMAGQIAAEELGVSFEDVDVIWADTGRTQESGSSSATRQTYFTGNAVRIAAGELREEVLDIAGKLLGVHPHELDIVNTSAENPNRVPFYERGVSADREHAGDDAGPHIVGRFNTDLNVPLRAVLKAGRDRGYKLERSGIFKPRTVCEDFDTGQSPRSFVTYLFGSHIAQVVVDIETGEVRVERFITCHDVGKAINPQSVEGQMIGGATQGIGMALMEEVVMQDGRMMNPNFTDYILPTIRDVPGIETVIVESNDPGGPFGAHGVGEPPLIAAVPAVLGAIGDAVGTMPDRTPCTPQRIWELLNPEEKTASDNAAFSHTPTHAQLAR